MNICFDTFGCRLNRAESLEEEAKAAAAGHKIVKTHAEADLIVVRGCSVTGRAQHDCESEIKRLKEKYPSKRIWVAGCLPGARALIIKAAASSGTSGGDPVPMRTARAYLKVQDGCNSSCTYCIVPKFRGKSKAVPFDEVMAKARAFVDAGYRELVVTGCNLCQYPDFPALVAVLCDISPDCRVRLGSIEPGPFAVKIVDLMKERANLCKFLHLSIQSGSQKVLAAMRRPYEAKDLEQILKYAAGQLPGLCIGCDLIAGFPRESLIDHQLSAALFLRHNITNAHVFPYSERPGTVAAADVFGQIPREVRRERARELAELASRNLERFKRRFVGKEVAVLVETLPADGEIAGWTSEYLWCECRVSSRTTQKPTDRTNGFRRQIVRVAVEGVSGRGLKGRIL